MDYESTFSREDFDRLRSKFQNEANPHVERAALLRIGNLCRDMSSMGWKMRMTEMGTPFPSCNFRCDILKPDGVGAYGFGRTKAEAMTAVVDLVAEEVMK